MKRVLPQLSGRFFLTDGGIETTLIFHERIELPHFAAFTLLGKSDGEGALRRYFRTYAEIAQRFGTGLILESPTWRASPDWGAKLGYGQRELAAANRRAIALLGEVRNEFGRIEDVVISGCVGPRGDGYVADQAMSRREALAYHATQVRVFQESGADLVTAITMNYADEAVGIARAAQDAGMPVAISFTVETDGLLPTGQTLRAAIEYVDRATAGYPSYYMVNCAHPTHFEDALAEGEAWTRRIRGVRANASRKSHAELNESSRLDAGDPAEFGLQHARLKKRFDHLDVMGGCCGTDHRHVRAIALACAAPRRAPEPRLDGRTR
jgi:S-methylmethionine-dependent homocysteine/selenocysteine methylase